MVCRRPGELGAPPGLRIATGCQMLHGDVRRSLPVLAWLVALAACGEEPRDAKQALCERLLSCDCSAPAYASIEACVADLDATATRTQARAEELGIHYDQDCAERQLLRHADANACKPADDLDIVCPDCRMLHGDRPIGASCTTLTTGVSDCASELVCDEGTCVAVSNFYCTRLAVGERCREGAETLGLCVEGAFCDAYVTDLCQPARPVGAACVVAAGCETLYCQNSVCAAPEVGAPCDGNGLCSDRFVCVEGLCAAPPGVGEACEAPVFVCEEGLECLDPSDTCQVEQAYLCHVYPMDVFHVML